MLANESRLSDTEWLFAELERLTGVRLATPEIILEETLRAPFLEELRGFMAPLREVERGPWGGAVTNELRTRMKELAFAPAMLDRVTALTDVAVTDPRWRDVEKTWNGEFVYGAVDPDALAKVMLDALEQHFVVEWKRQGTLRYAPDVRLALGDVVAHPRFGTGRVVKAGENRVTIRFVDKERTLRCRT